MYLGINFAIEPVSLGLINENNQILSDLAISGNHRFSENLINELDSLCKSCKSSLDDVKAIGVTQGPGSYTGIRVGITFAKTIAKNKKIPVFGFSTLEALANFYLNFDGTYFALLPACQNEINCALFGINQGTINRLTPDFTCASSVLLKNISQIEGNIMIIGFINDTIRNSLAGGNFNIIPTVLYGSNLALMAKKNFLVNIKGEADKLFPIYSHDPNLQKNNNRLPA